MILLRILWLIVTCVPVVAIAFILAFTKGDDAALKFVAWVWRVPYNRNPR